MDNAFSYPNMYLLVMNGQMCAGFLIERDCLHKYVSKAWQLRRQLVPYIVTVNYARASKVGLHYQIWKHQHMQCVFPVTEHAPCYARQFYQSCLWSSRMTKAVCYLPVLQFNIAAPSVQQFVCVVCIYACKESLLQTYFHFCLIYCR